MYYWIYAILYIFFTIIIGQLLIEQNLKLIYYLIMLLLYVSFNNIYFSVKYYIKLRNHKGIKGDSGQPGKTGEPGSNGTCVMSATCGIANCKKLIDDTLIKSFPEYKRIVEKTANNLQLSRKEQKILEHINKYIAILMPKCESFEDKSADFIKIIEETLKSPETLLEEKVGCPTTTP
jgi:hypothetical protein